MNTRRSGAALIWTIVVLSVLGATSTVALREFATVRRTLTMHHNRVQAEWLARAGAELAIARLLADEKYTGETLEPIADGEVRIVVKNDAAKPGVYQIHCETTFPKGDYRATNFSLTRTATRRTDGGKVIIDLAARSNAPPAP